jgi:hypothetical protein
MRRLAVFRSTSLTDHGACNPRAAVNKVSTPPFIFCPPHQAATIALRGMGAEVKFHSKWHRAFLAMRFVFFVIAQFHISHVCSL